MRFGVHMYGVNALFRKDKEAFLRSIAGAGYRFLEPCLAPDECLDPLVWTLAELEENIPLLEKYGLRICSCHITGNLPTDEQLISLAKQYGIRQYVLSCPKECCEASALRLTQTGNALRREGIELLLRNDSRAFEWLLRRCGDSLGAQCAVDLLPDPESFLWGNQAQIRSLCYSGGTADMVACAQFARAAEIIQYADLNTLDALEQMAHTLGGLSHARPNTKSILCILDTETGEVNKLRTFDRLIEAPNWMHSEPDWLLYNSDGYIWKYRISTNTEIRLDSGHCTNCNNDHVLSPDNSHIAVSHSEPGAMSQIYILPITGGEPRQITLHAPSYLHGWSPDGKELAYCAFRDHGNGTEVDVYAICAEGGEEWQLTRNAGFNDGPEYSPDGAHIWFNSTRSGLMQCYRMKRDGTEQLRMTFRERNNWFPHVSPDGKKVVYLSYSKDGLDPTEHLPNMQVMLCMMNADGSDDRTLIEFFGGQGSINVNSWHPDSRHLAFVMYELEHHTVS